MSKKRRGRDEARRPSTPPITGLRPRLDAMFSREGWAEQDVDALWAELDSAFVGLKAQDALPVLLRSYQQAPERVRRRLDEIIPGWLAARGCRDTLLALVERGAIYPEGQPTAVSWLRDAGVERTALERIEQEPSPFYRAYAYDDGSQGIVDVFWYTDRRRLRVRGMGFLIDHNPPWEGATKDIIAYPSRSPEDAIAEFVETSIERGVFLQEVGAAEAKDTILRSLEANRREGIRLPRDLIAARSLFLEHVLALPNRPGTPSFTAQDFDELARVGRPAEELRWVEQHVGRRVRLKDGQEVVILGGPLDEDWS